MNNTAHLEIRVRIPAPAMHFFFLLKKYKYQLGGENIASITPPSVSCFFLLFFLKPLYRDTLPGEGVIATPQNISMMMN